MVALWLGWVGCVAYRLMCEAEMVLTENLMLRVRRQKWRCQRPISMRSIADKWIACLPNVKR
jgi:hypothetical protein